jgi:hypothetical protein
MWTHANPFSINIHGTHRYMTRTIALLLFTCAGLLLSPQATAGLIGTKVSFHRVFDYPRPLVSNEAEAVVAPDIIEFSCCPGRTFIDLKDDSLRAFGVFSNSFNGGATPFGHAFVFDFLFDAAAVGIDILGAQYYDVRLGGVPATQSVLEFPGSRLRTIGRRLEIDVGGLGFERGSYIDLQLQVVPTPGVLSMLGLGLMMLWCGRSRRCHSSAGLG